jgi:hypothetical protein
MTKRRVLVDLRLGETERHGRAAVYLMAFSSSMQLPCYVPGESAIPRL